MKKILNIYHDHYRLLFWSVVVLLMLFAFCKPKLVDDAFISFRYAENLVDGHGFVFNPGGDRVEGYTNFLWVMLIAGGLLAGIQPEHFVLILSFPIYLACLLLSYRLAIRMLGNRSLGFIIMILVGTNYTVSTFATCGLETCLQLLEFLTVIHIVSVSMERGWNARRSLALSVTLSITLLTRPDAVVLAFVGLYAFFRSVKDVRPLNWICIAAPFVLVVFPYLIWKVSYFNALLPNSYHARVHGLTAIPYGLLYIYLFGLSYLLLPYLLVLPLFWKSSKVKNSHVGIAGLCVLTWIIYVVWVGGDFMEFRFLIPILPLLLIMIVRLIDTGITSRKLRYGLIFCIFLGSVNNGAAFGQVIKGWWVLEAPILSRPLTAPEHNLKGIGLKLKEMFEGKDVTIAVGSAGAIPYYSGLRTIDMLGVNDLMVPEIGNQLSTRAGHRFMSPLWYLTKQEVNLILWPIYFNFSKSVFEDWAMRVEWRDLYHYYLDIDRPIDGIHIREAHLLGIPVGDDLVTVAWYLMPHEAVEESVREYGLYRIRVTRPGYDPFKTPVRE